MNMINGVSRFSGFNMTAQAIMLMMTMNRVMTTTPKETMIITMQKHFIPD